MHDARITDWLAQLAARTPTPGGGAVAALSAASGAALLEMVANYTTGKRWADREKAMLELVAEAGELRARAVGLAAEDERAFAAVGTAYGLPKGTDDERAQRSAAIQAATLAAAGPPLEVGRLATRLVVLADGLVEPANPNVLSDVGVAAASARAALGASVTNVTVNAALLDDTAAARGLLDEAAQFEDAMERADAVAVRVLGRLRE